MKNLTLEQFNINTDFEQIFAWKKLYQQTPEYQKIVQFIFNGEQSENLALLLGEMHENHERKNNGRDFVFLAKNEHGEIVGVLVIDTYNAGQKNSSCYVHFIITNPAHNRKGVAKFMLKTFLLNPENFIGFKPNEVFANIKKNNKPSIELFKSLGFEPVSELGTSRLTQLRAPLDELQANLKNAKTFN